MSPAKRPSLRLDDSISSPQDMRALILEIRDYARWYSHAAIKKRVQVRRAGNDAPQLSPAATALLRDWNSHNPLSRSSLDALLKELERATATAPQLTITLAGPPAGQVKKSLVAWCRDNIAPNVLVTFQFNATILGGMVVRCGSRIFDWSFRRQILDNRQHFPEVLRHVR